MRKRFRKSKMFMLPDSEKRIALNERFKIYFHANKAREDNHSK